MNINSSVSETQKVSFRRKKFTNWNSNSAVIQPDESREGKIEKGKMVGGPPKNIGVNDRRMMKEHITMLLHRSRPNAPEAIKAKIPGLASRLECFLYYNATSLAEYSNRFTLQSRLKNVTLNMPFRAGKRLRLPSSTSNPDFIQMENNLRKREKSALNQRQNNSNPLTTTRVEIDMGVSFEFSANSNDNIGNGSNQEDDIEDEEDDDDDDEDDENDSFINDNEIIEEKKDVDDGIMAMEEDNLVDKEIKLQISKLYHLLTTMMSNEQCSFDELERLISNPKLRKHSEEALAHSIVAWIEAEAKMEDTPPNLATLLHICSDFCSKNDKIDPRLLNAILLLYKHHRVRFRYDGDSNEVDTEWSDDNGEEKRKIPNSNEYNNLSDPQIALRRCLDKLVLTHPTIAVNIVSRLLRMWPEKDSPQEIVFIMQLESIFRVANMNMIGSKVSKVIEQVAKCVSHVNWHVSFYAMNFASSFARFKHHDCKQAFAALKDQLIKISSSHWHPHVRTRAQILIKELMT